jgi:hypothetical protein
MAIVKASRKTIRVLERSPRSCNSFVHPHPGTLGAGEHFCEILRSCPRLQTLSVALPSVCACLSDENVDFSGDLQVRALRHCRHEDRWSAQEATNALQELLQEARCLIGLCARSTIPRELYVELFVADCIFEPGCRSVHGDFTLAHISSDGLWPQNGHLSGKGPYGSTGQSQKGGEGPFHCISEAEFLYGVGSGFHSLSV